MSDPGIDLRAVTDVIVRRRDEIGAERALLVAVSGIDASGKGYVAERLVERLEAAGSRVAAINVDGWLRLPHERFAHDDPGGHFYRQAIRFDDLFSRLVLPLRQDRSIVLDMDYAEETATEYRPHRYEYTDVDVVVLEGIFLLRAEYRDVYDVAVWVGCSWETALERAVARGQEGLPAEATVEAYRTIYFPAQEVHLARDRPVQAATVVVHNDPRRPVDDPGGPSAPRPAALPLGFAPDPAPHPGATAPPSPPGATP